MGAGDKAIGESIKGGSGKLGDKFKDVALESAQEALKRQRQLFKSTFPTTKEFSAQQLEALKTGGIGAQIPLIQRSVEQTRMAGSDAQRKAEESLGSSNLLNTPFGQSAMAQLQQQSRLAQSRIPTDFAQAFISGIPSFVGQTQNTATNLLGGAGQLGSGIFQQQSQAKSDRVNAKLGSAGSAAGGMAGSCDIRFKDNVVRVGTSPDGFGVYEFNYKSDPTKRYRGPVAQNVRRRRPEAVFEFEGALYVWLNNIDVPLEVIHG